jgi:hypothetical protein
MTNPFQLAMYLNILFNNTHPDPRTLARKDNTGRITRKGEKCPKENHLVNLPVTLSFK